MTPHPDRVAAALTAVIDDGTVERALTPPRVVEFWVPTLPTRALTSNSGAKRNGYAIERAKDELGEAAYFSALQALGPSVEFMHGQSDIFLDYHICYARRPQDGHYRFRDPSNGGGDVAKPIVDYGLVKVGVLRDDDHKYVRWFACTITPVETLAEEGIHVEVREARS